MTSFRTTSIRCDVHAPGCDDLSRGEVTGLDVGAKEARATSSRRGWRRVAIDDGWRDVLVAHRWDPRYIRIGAGIDVCPACLQLKPAKGPRR